MEMIVDSLLDAGLDSIRLLPFLFLAYLLMEYVEHKMGSKAKNTIQKAGKAGPFVGSLLGVVPQCGFSTVASNLYAGRIISLGTLFAVYLSTSDEMLPIFLSESVPVSTIVKILAGKCAIGMIAGFGIDLLLQLRKKKVTEEMMSGHICEHEHCHCEKGIVRSAVVHTIHIWFFILLISIVLNIILLFVGEEALKGIIGNKPVISSFLAGLVGLIPNCAASVVITQLYLEQIIPIGAMFSGLLVSAGVGLIVLFKVNEHIKENLKITALLYGIGVFSGILIQCFVNWC